MKKQLTVFLSPIVLLIIMLYKGAINPANSEINHIPPNQAVSESSDLKKPENPKQPTDTINLILEYAESMLGSPYVYAGMSPNGFDCSGYTTFVFDKYGINLPHSSALQANTGYQVDRDNAMPGDLVIFTGTDPNKREPGHVGIVLPSTSDTLQFIHASSNGGVKISQIEGTGYEERFLEIRRVSSTKL